MAQANLPTGLVLGGPLYAPGVYSTQATITNAMISATAAIDATKQQHQYVLTRCLTNHGSTPSAVRQTLHTVYGATATLVAMKCGVVTALASGTVTIDLYKNGSSVLSSALTLNSSTGTAFAENDVAGFSSASLVAGDNLELVLTVSSPSGGGGLFATVVIREDAAP